MNNEQAVRLLTFMRTGNIHEAHKAAVFIAGGKPLDDNAATAKNAEGVYLIYADGHAELYNGNNAHTESVKYIGVDDGSHRIALSLYELGEHPLPTKRGFSDKDFNYIQSNINAAYNFNGKACTAHLLKQGDFSFTLEEGEWIPSAGELALIYRFKDEINDALDYVEGDKLTDKWYWSSTEYSATIAWFINFSNGYLVNPYKLSSRTA